MKRTKWMKYNNTNKYLFSSFFFVEFISMIYNGVLLLLQTHDCASFTLCGVCIRGWIKYWCVLKQCKCNNDLKYEKKEIKSSVN